MLTHLKILSVIADVGSTAKSVWIDGLDWKASPPSAPLRGANEYLVWIKPAIISFSCETLKKQPDA